MSGSENVENCVLFLKVVAESSQVFATNSLRISQRPSECEAVLLLVLRYFLFKREDRFGIYGNKKG